jgi:DNA-binding IclR family transcriptional regulator
VSISAGSLPHPAGEAATEPPADGAAPRIQAVDRAVLLLKSVATSATPPTVPELAHACGLNRSTAWRLLRTLEHHGLIDRDPVTQRYTVGYGAIPIAAAITDDAWIRRVRPLLEVLCARFGESVTLAVAKRFNLYYVDQVDPPHIMAPDWLGKPLPLHATSGGKAFLAWLRPEERAAVLPKELPRYTQYTITTHGDLERELDEVRRTGFAVCISEYEEFSSGVSAAVLNSRGAPMAVVNVWGPTPRNPPERLQEMGLETVKTADEIAKLLD